MLCSRGGASSRCRFCMILDAVGCFSLVGQSVSQPRPGHICLFQLPNGDKKGGVELGFISSVWKGIRTPRLNTGETPVNSCVAFRAIALEPDPKEPRVSCFWMQLDVDETFHSVQNAWCFLMFSLRSAMVWFHVF